MHDVTLGLMGLMASMVRDTSLVRREFDRIGIVIKPATTLVLPPKGRAPAEEFSLLESIDVRITEDGRAAAVGVPIGTEQLRR